MTDLAMGDMAYGAYTAAAGLVSILVISLVACAKTEVQQRRVFIGSLLLVGAAGALQGVVRSAPLFFLCYATMLASCGAFAASMRTIRSSLIPSSVLGRSLSFIMLLNQATIPLSGAIVSVLGGVLEVRTIVFGQSALMLLILAIALALGWKPQGNIQRRPI